VKIMTNGEVMEIVSNLGCSEWACSMIERGKYPRLSRTIDPHLAIHFLDHLTKGDTDLPNLIRTMKTRPCIQASFSTYANSEDIAQGPLYVLINLASSNSLHRTPRGCWY
jgi:hypothetical protein